MSNSEIVECVRMSPNHSGKRTHKIDRITPHCVVGQLTAERIGECFPLGRQASSNYGIGYDGRVCLIVDEANRSWCSSSNDNDQRAVTIEVASDMTPPYAFNKEAYVSLVVLCADVCKRNGLTKVLWFGDKDKSLSYKPASNECVLTVHQWFAATACPGQWMLQRMGKLADDINAILNPKPVSDKLYRVQVGAFKNKENAENLLRSVENKGIDAFIVKVDGLYKVQVGAYAIKANAESRLQQMKGLGIGGFITETDRKQESFVPRKSNADIAREIYNGTCSDVRWSSWGTGDTRKQRLETAGYNYQAVQAEVNKLF